MTSAPRKPTTVPADFLEYQSKSPCGRPRTATSRAGAAAPMAIAGSLINVPRVSNGNPKKFVEPAAPVAYGQSAWRTSHAAVSVSLTQVPADPLSTPSASVLAIDDRLDHEQAGLRIHATGHRRAGRLQHPGPGQREPPRRVVEDDVQPAQAPRGDRALGLDAGQRHAAGAHRDGHSLGVQRDAAHPHRRRARRRGDRLIGGQERRARRCRDRAPAIRTRGGPCRRCPPRRAPSARRRPGAGTRPRSSCGCGRARRARSTRAVGSARWPPRASRASRR